LNLAKNPLRSLAASAADMPRLEAFPKSHQVTFNYYAGVIHFLEEDYKKVRLSIPLTCALLTLHFRQRTF
jgi:hypothetical protein